jgi:hypothetical protein
VPGRGQAPLSPCRHPPQTENQLIQTARPQSAPKPGSNAAIRQRLASALPVADLEQIAAAGGAATAAPLRPAHLLRPISRGGPVPAPGLSVAPRGLPPPSPGLLRSASGLPPASFPGLLPLIIVPDADASMQELAAALATLPRRVFAADLPPRRHLAQLRSVAALAAVLVQGVAAAVGPGPYAVAGVGAGGVIAHELAAQLQRAGQQVRGWVGIGRCCTWEKQGTDSARLPQHLPGARQSTDGFGSTTCESADNRGGPTGHPNPLPNTLS